MLTTIGQGVSALFGWLVKNPTIMLLLIFTAMFVMVVVSKDATIAEIRHASIAKDARIGDLTRDNTTLKNNNTSLSASVKTQNAALDQLLGRSQVADAKFDELMASLAKGDATLSKRLAVIDAAKPGADQCESAYALIQGSVQ